MWDSPVRHESYQAQGLRMWWPLMKEYGLGKTGVREVFSQAGKVTFTTGAPILNTYSSVPGFGDVQLMGGAASASFGWADTPVALGTTNTISATCWIRVTGSLASYDGIFQIGFNSIAPALLISGAGGNPFTYMWDGSSTEYNAATGLTLSTQRCYFAVVSIAPGGATLYLGEYGGQLNSWTRSASHSAKVHQLTDNMYIGRDRGSGGREFPGDIWDCRVYDRSLSRSDVEAMHANPFDLYRRRTDSLRFTQKAGAAGEQFLTPSGIASTEAIGSPVMTPGTVTLTPTGVAAANGYGAAVIVLGTATISPTGTAAVDAYGTATIAVGAVTITPGGLATDEALGTSLLALAVTPSGITTAGGYGSATVTPGGVLVTPTGISATDAYGSTTVTVGTVTLLPAGIASSEVHGNHTLQAGAVAISPTGFTDETVGDASVVTPILIVLTGLASDHVTPSPALTITLSTAGIATAEAFGSSSVLTGVVVVSPTGLADEFALGLGLFVFTGSGEKGTWSPTLWGTESTGMF